MIRGLNKALYNMNDSVNEYQERNSTKIAARWDQKAHVWDEHVRKPNSHLNQDGGYDLFIEESKKILAQRDNSESLNLLEIGCGTGLVSEALQNERLNITGIDISKEMLSIARKKNILNANFILADLFNLPSKKIELADVILSRGILLSHYSIDDTRQLLTVIQKCGVLGKSVAMLDFLNGEAANEYHHRPSNKTYFIPTQLEQIAFKLGFNSCRFLGNKSDRVRFIVIEF